MRYQGKKECYWSTFDVLVRIMLRTEEGSIYWPELVGEHTIKLTQEKTTSFLGSSIEGLIKELHLKLGIL